MGWLDEVESAIAAVVAATGPSVVGIEGRGAAGSGVVVADGRVVTNAHNLRGGAVTVTFADGSTAEGTAAGVDVDGDVAVVAVPTGTAPAIAWAEAGVGIGAPVFALANPGGRGLRATPGVVSGTERSFRGPRGRRMTGSIEHTAPLLPGSSGGPVVDRDGRLLGINTNRLGEGFYLAIPADAALRQRLDTLAAGQAPARPRLGIALAPAHVARHLRRAVGLPERDGLLVRAVDDDGPAAAAGIAAANLIVAAGEAEIASVDGLFEALATANGSLTLTVVRGTDERTVEVTLG